jgi:glycyl-tRNA synthetase alpha chain
MYLDSLGALGIDIRHHDIRFEEDNWEAPTLGAWGIGWQIMLDGLEITQFTYFQQSGGVDLEPISVELTYGLERIAAFLQNVEDVYHIHWNETVTYGEMRQSEELELSVYDFEKADPEVSRKIFDLYEGEAARLLEEYRKSNFEIRNSKASSNSELDQRTAQQLADTSSSKTLTSREHRNTRSENRHSTIAPSLDFRVSNFEAGERFPLRKVYDLTLKCSHLFNILDARGAISVTERVALIARIRKLACQVAAIYLERQTAAEVPA